MKRKRSVWSNCFFVFAFLVLTFFCWCPLFYGSYGPAKRILGIPSWAVLAFVFGAVLFVLEWIYLFVTRRAMSDEELPDVVSELAGVDADAPDAGKEGG
ncbi:MAG: DUF997 domain-containing protein [Planctomycetota bacterium]|jgi:hypothetical protein